MADFISALNGTQMDEALLDVAEHNSEAWAVGTRNGVEVQEGDITFQNNSQYYAQLAASQITGDITDAVRWDTDQSTILTDEAKARARNNINAAPYNDVATNLNLLDNPWWGSAEAINQRSATSWTGTSTIYTIDRWKYSSSVSGNSAELRSDGIRFSLSYGSSNFFYTYQILSQPLFNSIKGKVATASVLLSDGTIKSGTTTIPSSGTATFISEGSVTVTINNNGEFTVRILVSSTIRAVKLELCSWSTLANDVPPDKGIELAKCIASTADPSDPYANSGYARSNRNLLDNPFFTVNQRNFTTGEGTAAGLMLVDRWQAIRATVTRNTDNSLTVTPTQAQYGICQFIEQSRLKVGKTYTMSALIDNQYYSGSFVFSTSPASEYFATFSNGIRFYRHVANNKVDVWVIRDSTTAFAVQAVKLELGSYSTLINDTPPDYGEELAKCQYYYREIKCTTTGYAMIGFATAATAFQACLPYVMRVRPTITYSGTLNAYYAGGNSPVTAVAANGEFTNSIQVAFTTSGLTAGSIVALAMGSGAKLMFSADL